MSSLDDILQWYRYNSHVRKKYIETLRQLPRSNLFKRTGASFPSVLQIFVHVLDAYRWWFIFVMNDRLGEYRRLRTRVKSVSEARLRESEVDSLVIKYVECLKPTDLKRNIVWHDGAKVKKATLDTILHHMIEEELQHRGEINAVLWQMNVDPPVTGWDDWIEVSAKN